MKNIGRIVVISLISFFATGVFMWLFNLFSLGSTIVRETYTHFALSQIAEHLNESEADFPRTTTELLTALRAPHLDWNSCEFDGDKILDG